jgi:hypothetical protein
MSDLDTLIISIHVEERGGFLLELFCRVSSLVAWRGTGFAFIAYCTDTFNHSAINHHSASLLVLLSFHSLMV